MAGSAGTSPSCMWTLGDDCSHTSIPPRSVYALASQVVLLGFYLAGLCPSLSSRQEEKQPGLSLPVSGGARNSHQGGPGRPRFQEAFLEGFFRSRVSMADVTPAIFRSSGSVFHCLNREF